MMLSLFFFFLNLIRSALQLFIFVSFEQSSLELFGEIEKYFEIFMNIFEA
jgi:hypothetical protein